MILLSAVCQIIRWFVKAPIQNTIYVALIKKATLLTASSYTENDLCSLLSCHLLKYIVHKPVSKAWSTTHTCPKHICGNANTSCQWAVNMVFRKSQQLYYFIWTDLRGQDLNSSVYQNQHDEYFKASSRALSATSLPEQHWRLNTVITTLNHDPGKYSNFLKDNSSLMSTWPFLVSKSCIFRMLWWMKIDHSTPEKNRTILICICAWTFRKNTVFPHIIYTCTN